MSPQIRQFLTLLAFAAWSAGCAYGGWLIGSTREQLGCLQDKTTVRDATDQRQAKAVVAGNAVERKAVQRAAKTERFFDQLEQGARDHAQSHPTTTTCDLLDDDGLRRWRAANAGPEADAAATADGTMLDLAATEERPGEGTGTEPHRGGEAVLANLPATSGPGGVGEEHP